MSLGPRLEGRIVLVTGASRGFGRAVAVAVARTGAHLIATARTRGALEDLDDEIRREGFDPPTLAPLDLTDTAAVNGLGAGIMARFQRLDGLVHAAGMLGALTPVAHIKPDLMDGVLALGVTAVQRLIASLDVPIRQSEDGRAVYVTCRHGRDGRPFFGAFAAPRAAADALVLAYANETAKTRLRVNLFDPGPMATRLRREGYPGEAPGTHPAPDTVAPHVLPLLASSFDATATLVSAAGR